MGGNRRFRGMRHPASKGYSKLPTTMKDSTKDNHDDVGLRRHGVLTMVVVLCVCILAAGAVFLMKYSSTISSDNPIQDVSSVTEGYTSTSFGADASEVATELLTGKMLYGYSSAKFNTHRAQTLTADELKEITKRADIDHLYSVELAPLLIVRVPGTQGIVEARQHIVSELEGHGIWDIEEDSFEDRTPYGMKGFVNVVATLRPKIKRRLVIACHYDSKYYAPRRDGKVFIGATDSAVPCAMMLDLGRNLADLLSSTTQVSTSLQLIFFDGEEAFKHWTSTDSLYGSRHLARKMQDTPHPQPTSKTNQLDAMDMFILLDLIGTGNPTFRNYYPSTSIWFSRLVDIETRLKDIGAITARDSSFFDSRHYYAGVEDDHRPFVSRGVNRVIHLIAHPFPEVWHTFDDNAEALHAPTIDDLNKILHVFVAEYLHLLDSQPAAAA